jgi:hypothetical protein
MSAPASSAGIGTSRGSYLEPLLTAVILNVFKGAGRCRRLGRFVLVVSGRSALRSLSLFCCQSLQEA